MYFTQKKRVNKKFIWFGCFQWYLSYSQPFRQFKSKTKAMVIIRFDEELF